MKRFLLLVGLVATVGLTAAAASQAAVVLNDTFPISGTVINPCNGELVPFTGDVHIVIRETTNGAGGFNFGIHENIHATGTGAPSGAKYELNAVVNEEINNFFFTGPGATEATIVLNEVFAAQGNVPNFTLKILEHITITPNGDITSVKFTFDTECRG